MTNDKIDNEEMLEEEKNNTGINSSEHKLDISIQKDDNTEEEPYWKNYYELEKEGETSYLNIWYSTEERIKSVSKFRFFDDRGSLYISGDNMQFTSRKTNIQINKSNIKNISITKQKIPWTTYLLTIFIIISFLFSASNIRYLIMLMLFYIPSIGKWVLIEFLDQNGNLRKAYFADGSILGWSGLFGGTQKVYDSIRS